MRNAGKRISSLILAIAMIVSSFTLMPASVKAESKDMAHLVAGAGNGNGHFGGAKAEAFILSDKADITNDDLGATFRINSAAASTRLRFVTKYVDDNNWSYIGYDTGSGWIFEYKLDGSTSYGTVAGLATPAKDEFFNVETTYTDEGLKVTVGDTYATVTNNDFLALKDKAGKVGVGAGYFSNASTGAQASDIYFSDYKIGNTTTNDFAKWTLYNADAEGQKWTASETVTWGEPDNGNEPAQNGRTWFKVTGGTNNAGGHAYGNASSKAPVTLLDKDRVMEEGGTISLKFKPSNNWGIFYSYVDDNNWLYVGYDSSSKWYFQYNLNGSGSYPQISGLPDPVAGEEMEISISLSHETLSVTVNGETKRVTNQSLINYETATAGKGRFGVKTNGATTVEFADFKYNGKDCMSDNWGFAAERDGQKFESYYTATTNATGTVVDDQNNPVVGATVRLGNVSATTNAEGKYSIENLEMGEYALAITKPGYVAYSATVNVVEDATANVFNATLTPKGELDLTKYDTIASKAMKVYVGKTFPLIARYEMADGTFMRATEEDLNKVAINGIHYDATSVVKASDATSKTYTVTVKNSANNVDMTFDIKISVDDNDVTWEVLSITKGEGSVKLARFNIPGLSFATADARDNGANFAGARASSTTTSKADTYITFDKDGGFVPSDKLGYLYAFVGTDELNAGVFSNSEAEGDLRLIRNNTADAIQLQSADWYYEMGDTNGNKNAANYAAYPVSELPYAKISVAGDMNDDNIVNWNDGAVAFRDVMHYAYGYEMIKDTVNYRISMNFQSAASNPYLVTADNIKKVYLATDGLPQAVMLKGYGNEGHDSANSEYADIAERLGGVEDFQKLIQIAHDYNTEIGIHVNAQEAYPEAKSFCEEMVFENQHGWGWLDQSYAIDKLWDLSSQARFKRFVQLYDRINNTTHYSRQWPDAVENSKGEVTTSREDLLKEAESLENNMDFIYLDVWYQDAWETRRIAEEINTLGWRFSTEFATQGEYDSTWQHWATEGSYGGAGSKGFNSDIIRFLRNDQRDSQVLNYPSYGGTADNPLLGGYTLEGFEGWGSDISFDEYLQVTWLTNFPTRFLQHYYVTKWENYAEGESPVGNSEKQITLVNDEGDKVVVTRKEEQRKDEYIERIITLNGKVVLDEVKYLLPWTDTDGNEKLYHYNYDGGVTTWELQEDWAKLGSVIVYKLTDNGRVDETEVKVVNGTLTLDAEAKTAYVVTKGKSKVELKNNYGEMDYVVDPGFNGYNGYNGGSNLTAPTWSGDIDNDAVKVVRSSQYNVGDNMLTITSPTKDVFVSTTISGLTKGQTYVAEVYVQNNCDSKAFIMVDNGKEVVSEYAQQTYAVNYVRADNKKFRPMQRMQVYFTAESETAKLTLERESGDGVTYFDDIRIVPITLNNYRDDQSFVQDFENVVNGIYPFVTGGLQGVNDQNIHLSQLHAPYTQAGWNDVVIDDVLDGEWSLKWNAKAAGAPRGLVYQTIPQNFRFAPGVVYKVEFDYQTGAQNGFGVVVGNTNTYNLPSEYLPVSYGADKDGHYEFEVIGAGNGQTWFGIYSNGVNNGFAGNLILDNLKITVVEDAVAAVIANDSLYLGETTQIVGSNLDSIDWSVSGDTDKLVFNEKDLTVTCLGVGTITITYTIGDEIKTFTVNGFDSISSNVEVDGMSATANTEENSNLEDGRAKNAVDGNTGTYWHSNWSTTGFNVTESNPAILTVDLGATTNIAGFKLTNRNGNNGIVYKLNYKFLDENQNELYVANDVELEGSASASVHEIMADKAYDVRYLVIEVTKGSNNFASIAEISLLNKVDVVTTGKVQDITVDVDMVAQVKVDAGEGKVVKGLEYAIADQSIARVDERGNVFGVKPGTTTITVTNAAGFKASAKVTVTGTAKPDTKPEYKGYDDVDSEAWYADMVKEATIKGLMSADAGGTKFNPEGKITRGMVATVLYRMEGQPKVTFTDKFADVKGGLWYSESIIWASEAKVVSGYANGKFGPDDAITREDFAIMLRNYANACGLKTNSKQSLTEFKDYKAVSAYAKDAVAWCVENGLMSGSKKGEETYLNPTSNTTRAEAAKMFVQLSNLIKK